MQTSLHSINVQTVHTTCSHKPVSVLCVCVCASVINKRSRPEQTWSQKCGQVLPSATFPLSPHTSFVAVYKGVSSVQGHLPVDFHSSALASRCSETQACTLVHTFRDLQKIRLKAQEKKTFFVSCMQTNYSLFRYKFIFFTKLSCTVYKSCIVCVCFTCVYLFTVGKLPSTTRLLVRANFV